MLCLLDNGESMCLYKKCRYFYKGGCLLTNIDRDAWPRLSERERNKAVEKLSKAVRKTELKKSKK